MEEEKGNPRQMEFHSKYGRMTDYISTPKDPKKKTQDPSNASFLLSEDILEQTQEYMKIRAESEENFDLQSSLFNQIYFLLKCNQNVALYGYGSKFKLIESFLKEKGAENPILVFYGYSGTISLAGILSTLEKFITEWRKFVDKMDIEYAKLGKTSRLNAIIENLKKILNQERLYVVMHNIDGKNIIDEQTQLALSELAKIDQVSFLVSFDNVRYLSLMPSQIRRNFNFAFINFNTYQVYQRELELKENLITCKEDKKVKALVYILKSLSKNQKDIIEIIAKYLLENQEENEISHKRLFEECVENMVVMKENQLKENLIEILDHKVIREKKGEGGKIIYTMDYPVNVLSKIVNKQLADVLD